MSEADGIAAAHSMNSASFNDSQNERFQKMNDKEQRAIVSWVKENFLNIKMSRAQIERQWYLNLCFYYGKQNVVFRQLPNFVVGTSGSLYVPPAPYWRSRPVINRIRPTIRAELARLTKQKPSAYIVPASSDDLDLFAAQAGEQIWESQYRDKNLKSIFRRWIWWTLICGNGFVKCFWDPDAIDFSSNLMGDISYCHETPFHIFVPDFREETLEGQPFVLHAQIKSEEWVKINYPDVQYSANTDKENEILDQSWLNLVGAQNMKGQKGVLCLEIWVKPGGHHKFPEGAMFTVIGDTIVQGMEGWPYEHRYFPFAKLDHIPTGRFYSDSSINDLISLQREYNRTRGQIIENKNRMSKLQLVAEKGSIDASKITTEPGQVIEYQPGFQKPEPLPLQNLPAYVLQELDRILMDMNDVSGSHEVSKGQVPSGVTAATAINFLQEQDEMMLSSTFDSLEEGVEKIAKMTLTYARQFWDTPRIVKITGTDGSFDAMAFKGSNLRDNTDIRVEGGSALPTSRAAKQAFIMDLMKMGFVDPTAGLEVMEMGGIQKIYETLQVDVRQSQRENLKMANINPMQIQQFDQLNQMQVQAEEESAVLSQMVDGEETLEESPPSAVSGQLIVPVNSWDNHQIHIETHNRYRKSQSFENLPPEVKALFEQHVQQHQFAMQQQMMTDPAMFLNNMTSEDSAEGEESGTAPNL